MTVHVGPDIPLTVTPDTCAANHQHGPVPEEQERVSRTQERLRAVRASGADDVEAMRRPPLYQYSYDEGLGTVYTAACRPAEGRVTCIWPGERWEQSFQGFTPGSRTVTIGGRAVPLADPAGASLAARPHTIPQSPQPSV